MMFPQLMNVVPGVALSNIITLLLDSIKRAKRTEKRFKPLLDHLNDTVNWVTPRVVEISRSTDSHEIEGLLNHLTRAKEIVDKSNRVSSWSYAKKYKFAKELIEVDNSIRTMLDVFFPVMIYEDTRKILDSMDELKMLVMIFFSIVVEDLHSGAKNTGGIVFDLIRSKASFEKIVNSQPAELVNDIALWKRKKISGSLFASSAATWLLQQVYEYNFLTIVSWVAIFAITALFIWRCVNRFLDREEATKLRLEKLREQVAMETANACWEVTDKVIRWVLYVTDVEGNCWSVFPQTVAFLLLFSYAGTFFDLPTLCRGVMMGTTFPMLVAKNWDRIKPFFGSVVGKVGEKENKKKMKKQN
ncbi:Reticulan like protein B13 [Gossypium australe]|uniref:Reticulon-like protein n=1 Tax=Gossypium australe TaxID=47621 RepID=A0A5B6UUY6_9ROSI|nr:Reticulan like protein B13 [Gossypium australe]